jgi:thiol-disulfide isomerase/thioredoxin
MIKVRDAVLLFAVLVVIACVPTTPEKIAEQVSEKTTSPPEVPEGMKVPVVPEEPVLHWKNMQLKDAKTQLFFKISDFRGQEVLLESFAVWCPKCKQQQDIFIEFKKKNPNVVIISLDTDPNEDEARVVEHITRYGYDWQYAVSPAQLTRQLIDEFGLSIVSAPSTPVIVLCADQTAFLTKSGIKSVSELESEIETGC